MQKQFEGLSKASDNIKPLSKQSEDPTIKLEQLRTKHGFGGCDESKDEPNVFELQRRKQQQELRDKATGGWEPSHGNPEKSRPPMTLKGGMEGSSVSGTTDMTRGIHGNDLSTARAYMETNHTGDYLQYRRVFSNLLSKCHRGEPVKATLVEWQEGSDEMMKAFANKALEEANTRRTKNWNNDDD